jgi:hypothetical protein
VEKGHSQLPLAGLRTGHGPEFLLPPPGQHDLCRCAVPAMIGCTDPPLLCIVGIGNG